MGNFYSRKASDSFSETDHSKRIRVNFLEKLVAPAAMITDASERRQASLVSAFLLVLSLTLIIGVVYMAFFSTNPIVGLVLAGADITMIVSYILSRTRHYRLAVLLSLAALTIIPILNVELSNDHSSEALLLLLIWNTLTILLSSAMTTTRTTILFASINIFTLFMFPVFIPSIIFSNIALPLIFNIVISLIILVFMQHRNLMEKDRMLEVWKANQQLHVELGERKQVEKKLAYTALHDSLTGLPNRILFMDRLTHAMQYAKRHQDFTFAVFFIDLDRFKVVNDSLGHDIGDLLLVESARRLKSCIRTMDTVARFGGDEFVILLEGAEAIADYVRVADRIQHDLAVPADLNGYLVFVSVSMGIVLSDVRYERPEDIIRDADIAMYRTKRQNRGKYRFFDPAMLDGIMSRLELETDLRIALEQQQFIVHYQPILDILTRGIVGFEALIRWQHPTRGLTMPGEFIPIIEEIGLIVPIGYWVLDEACRQIRIWQEQYPTIPPLTVNVNLSTKQCAQPDLVEKIVAILKKYQLDASSLKLELTESLIVEDSESTAATLSKLRDLGIQVQIDDFGTGYSSLSYLHTLPIDTLKIDRTFINRLGTNDSGSDIVRTILALAHGLGMKVIAEGVETDDQLSILQSMDCEFVQGFLFAKGLSSQDADAMLEKSIIQAGD